ncbi:Resistance to inhibitors of cholinesterase protein 19 [Caenorhabditis elegans]|uniref:Resistance to inhibitors of cholinesterase protein 19 n=1 Tax=Caenorhabditis elegans TaxID=6239 RepID=RIC19_CAEEL|nr:Resistance to inhibitors of cholinesterase protein 19 [Caenorhabditis elegans]P91124.2 RecName: Full=Resistance to inhibitors of cholinesterase protein 19; AltName: Full=ICA1 homolog [Caenorhabditis elegans]CCD66406.1 Resistance to inhibitors of cholinesterase protein 19 [Caenorhabditis elegans]|eukprot:NP_491216.2 Resistance to inhibitors of cholinesterase protein 19 [Caenorhabditis elegans]
MAAQFYERNTSGMNADRFMTRLTDESTVNTMQRHYWTARQFIRTKLGKKEDEHLEASDNELDTCLNLYRSVHGTSFQLLNNVDNYANFLLDETLVQNVLGKYLKEKGKIDKTEAVGRILIAVGRSLLFSSHRLNAARIGVSTFYNKLSVFVERAIGDCSQTIEAVQMCRTEYRGSLLWMKKTSEELDPEVDGSMEKFREAQTTVKSNKERLDRLKTDTLQKVDLLSASRSNLLSYVLTHYQNELYEYYSKTSRAFETLAENINCYNNYDFEILSHLATGTKPERERKSEKEESAKTSQPRGNEEELKNLLFGRESPQFGEEEVQDESRSQCDSPLIEDVDDERRKTGDLLDLESAASIAFPIGPLATLFDTSSFVPPILPPPKPNAVSDDILSLFDGNKANSSGKEASATTMDWQSLIDGFDRENEDNLL